MTTKITVEACCAEEKEVVIELYNLSGLEAKTIMEEKVILQDGEKHECYIYDNRLVGVKERLK